MGGCIGSARDGGSLSGASSDFVGTVLLGRNHPLRPEKPKWESDIVLTERQLRRKREEFWDTAPAFEGRKEIWDALKAAAQALENGDHQLAQAIVDGASISLPHGTLLDCYDELGGRYQLPVYVLSAPTNLVADGDGGDTTPSTEGGNGPGGGLVSPGDEAAPPPTLTSPGVEVGIKFRLSTNKDMKLIVRTTDTVLNVKRRIEALEGVAVSRQKFLFSGRVLSDKTRFADVRMVRGAVIQVAITAAAV